MWTVSVKGGQSELNATRTHDATNERDLKFIDVTRVFNEIINGVVLTGSPGSAFAIHL